MGKARRPVNRTKIHNKTRRKKWRKNNKLKNAFTLSQTERERLQPFVKNLSSIKLTDIQLSALAKGLKHIPDTKKPSRLQLIKDVNAFQRRMRIKYLMRNKEQSTFHQFRLPSKWSPLDTGCLDLEDYLECTKKEICHLRLKQPPRNLSVQERTALKELSKNPQITIKKFDKGRGIAILNSYEYTQIGLRHLDSHHYELIEQDLTLKTAHTVKDLLLEMVDSKRIDDTIFHYLNPFSHDLRKNCRKNII